MDEQKAIRELENLKEHMTAMADYLEENDDVLDGTVDVETTIGILRALLNGHSAESIVENYGLEVEGV